MTRVLVIDDEPQIRRFLNICLGSQGYQVLEAEDGRRGLAQAALHQPDVLIMDLGLPDMDGQQLLKTLREFYLGPLIVLSVRNGERDKVQALDNGANDYVEKPFGANELLARIRSVLRTFASIEVPPSGFDDGYLKVDLQARRVRLGDEDVHLSRKEFELLRCLISHPGRIITQQQLLKDIWGPHHSHDTHYLRIFIGRLRSKLDDDPTAPRYIETEAGVGYRFIG
ncbi:DNA-binding response regulator [Pseudomonas jilinensis]|uniref:DNA-binding response regulator n=1 Tax=Pseudomonas jilinensis TaxID=2078689 RepID=A0A396S008_9PSED|nr:DNA-binding response regulator [Pseudomonas jilinensis]